MKTTKASRNDAKTLFRACLDNGVLDENRVRATVEELATKKPRGFLATLSFFGRLVRLDIERRSARIENAIETTPDLMRQLNQTLENRHGRGLAVSYWVTPALIAGLRIRVGNDIYDGSVSARLKSLSESL